MEKVILVNKQDQAIGLEEKIKAHELALLHRAFSVFVYRIHNGATEILLQQRHPDKYHCGGLWTNTCCSHPREGEQTRDAAKRRLKEEMGFECELEHCGQFIYKAEFDNGLTEHELDHVFIGEFNGEFQVNPIEVADIKWLSIEQVQTMIDQNDPTLTPWFGKAFELVKQAKQV